MIAIIKAQFNQHLTDLLLAGCTDYLDSVKADYIVFECPGAIETVVYTNYLIKKSQYKAIIVMGAIVKGETDHYEYVSQYVTNGFSQIAATHITPVIFGILTVQNESLAFERASPDKMNKGKEFGETALWMIEAFK